ncbi:MAG: hypothetical protein LBF56_01780 [Holosporales bacterium]|jgi:hypothetical protein|nr:hypothetical protein [Holosporales bacterium]
MRKLIVSAATLFAIHATCPGICSDNVGATTDSLPGSTAADPAANSDSNALVPTKECHEYLSDPNIVNKYFNHGTVARVVSVSDGYIVFIKLTPGLITALRNKDQVTFSSLVFEDGGDPALRRDIEHFIWKAVSEIPPESIEIFDDLLMPSEYPSATAWLGKNKVSEEAVAESNVIAPTVESNAEASKPQSASLSHFAGMPIRCKGGKFDVPLEVVKRAYGEQISCGKGAKQCAEEIKKLQDKLDKSISPKDRETLEKIKLADAKVAETTALLDEKKAEIKPRLDKLVADKKHLEELIAKLKQCEAGAKASSRSAENKAAVAVMQEVAPGLIGTVTVSSSNVSDIRAKSEDAAVKKTKEIDEETQTLLSSCDAPERLVQDAQKARDALQIDPKTQTRTEAVKIAVNGDIGNELNKMDDFLSKARGESPMNSGTAQKSDKEG